MYWLIKMKKAGIAFCVEPAIELESMPGSLQYAGALFRIFISRDRSAPDKKFSNKMEVSKELEDLSKTLVWSQSESWGWIIITTERNNIA